MAAPPERQGSYLAELLPVTGPQPWEPLCPSGAGSHAASLAPCPAQTCSRCTPPFPKAASTSHQPSAGEAGTQLGRPAGGSAGVAAAGHGAHSRAGRALPKAAALGSELGV